MLPTVLKNSIKSKKQETGICLAHMLCPHPKKQHQWVKTGTLSSSHHSKETYRGGNRDLFSSHAAHHPQNSSKGKNRSLIPVFLHQIPWNIEFLGINNYLVCLYAGMPLFNSTLCGPCVYSGYEFVGLLHFFQMPHMCILHRSVIWIS